MTNAALRDRKTAMLNETLTTVHVLGVYESIICTDKASWYRHVDGMAQIIRMRGSEMLADPIGLRLFFTLRNQILVSSMEKDRLILDFREPEWQKIPEIVRRLPSNVLAMIMAELPVLQGELKVMIHKQRNDPLTSYEDEIQALSEKTEKLDADLEAWRASLPQGWKPAIHHANGEPVEPQSIWKNTWHVYPDIWKPTVWNQFRIAKIMINVVLWYLLSLPSGMKKSSSDSTQKALTPGAGVSAGDSPLYTEFRFIYSHSPEERMATSVHIMRTMVDEICFSVPFELGHAPGKQRVRAIPLGGYFLLWPLAVAVAVRAVPKEQKEWIKRRMDYVSDVVGIRNARCYKGEGPGHFEK